MGIDFNAEFAKLNTNTVGDSANKLDNEECQAAITAAFGVLQKV